MSQEIKFEVDRHDILTPSQLLEIANLALRYPKHNLRIDATPTNVKVYIGAYYRERYRFWILPDGRNLLVEQDSSEPSDEDSDWDLVELIDAHTWLDKHVHL